MKINKLINSRICLDDWTNMMDNIKPTDIDKLAYYLYISENDDPYWNLYGFIIRKDQVVNYYNRANIIFRQERKEKIKILNNVQH